MSSKSSPLLISIGAAMLLLTIALYATLSSEITPRISDGRYRISEEGAWQPFTDTLPSSDNPQNLDLAFSLTLNPLHARIYQIIADDCVEKLAVNGQEVGQGVLPFCDLSHGRVLHLGQALHAGNNLITMTIQNVGGPASYTWRIAWRDPLLLSLRILLLLGLIAGSILLGKGLALPRWHNTFFGVFCGGVVLRLLYVFATPYQVRAYDADGHLEYIRYVAQHLALPPIREGWEFYQAPLYYVFTGLWLHMGSAAGRALSLLIRDIQWIAFFSSAFALAGMGWIVTLVFSPKEKLERGLFFASLAVLPSIVFLAPRINNDVFLFLWEIFCFAFLLKWWQHGRWRNWWIALLLLALSILTKTNGLLLVPVAFLLLILKPRLPLKKKMLVGALSLLLLTLATGWIFTLRSGASLDQPLVVNIGNLSSALFVNNTVETFTEFNPARMVARPFNNPWDDTFGRQYFWEYFFKSAFFGEFDFGPALGPLASAILVCAFLTLLYSACGAYLCIRREGWRTLPLWSAACLLLVGHALHRYVSAFSCSQDFRYSLLVSVPVLFFAIRGLKYIRSPFLRAGGVTVILASVVLQVAFLAGIIAIP
ncbi:MAG: glycosyltransferase family 39 protein [Candidatus Peribacteraceae bacterium]|nr:glycosyltransferase family 39 protein [Candidatus Peribacteraceae bacterium]MDD5742014.1 glycosyltransferase family 39 protein [Candidatus Peribacteraceae bacterium]